MSAIQLFDLNAQERFNGTALGGVGLATKTLTSAQILLLNTSPVTIVPAPGVGKIVMPVQLAVATHPGSTAYDTNTTVEVGWIAFINVLGLDVLGQTTPGFGIKGGVNDIETTSDVNNAPLVIGNAFGDPATGNGTITVSVLYAVVPIST